MTIRNSTIFESFLELYSIHVPNSHRNPIPSQFYEDRFHFAEEHDQTTKVSLISLERTQATISSKDLPACQEINPTVSLLPATSHTSKQTPSRSRDRIKTAIEIIAPFSQFTVSNIIEYFERLNLRIECIVHCVFTVTRDPKGKLQSIKKAIHSKKMENWIYIESTLSNPEEQIKVAKDLKNITEQLHLVVHDFKTMKEQIHQLNFSEKMENYQLSQWISENLILLGTILDKQEAFGIFRQREENVSALYRDALQSFPTFSTNSSSQDNIHFQESRNRIELVYRKHVLLIYFQTASQSLILTGYFAPKAEISWKKEIPNVNQLMNQIYSHLGLTSFSYFSRQIDRISQELPVAIFFTRRPEVFYRWFENILARIYSNQLDIVYIEDEKNDSLWMLMFIPQELYEYIPLYYLKELLKSKNIEIDYEFSVEINRLTIVWHNLKSDQGNAELIEILESNKENFLFSWQYKFQRLLAQKKNTTIEEFQTANQSFYYLSTLSKNYPRHCTPSQALKDIHIFENWFKMKNSKNFQTHITIENEKPSLVRIYSINIINPMKLISVLTDYGFQINALNRLQIHLQHNSGHVILFGLHQQDRILSPSDTKRITESIDYTLNQKIPSESIDSLVLVSTIDRLELILIKTWVAYLTQIDKSITKISFYKFLLENPIFTQTLLHFFHFRFGGKDKQKFQQEKNDCDESKNENRNWQEVFEKILEALPGNDAYRIANHFLQLIHAIVRSNYSLQKNQEKEHIDMSIKVLTKKIPTLENKMGLYDLFIYSYDWEGIHIRAEKVARGGIRWSDRLDDYRTEIFNLMRAQTNKNTIIVPSGSKGGFVVKKEKKNYTTEQWLEVGKSIYQRFIQSLLEVTDNRDPLGKILPASNGSIQRLDGDDSYLVVAADKGTGNFSDLANEISHKAGYWLGDAFASGGSHGYNHKEQGITAKGAWISFLRHAKERGIFLGEKPITVVGIGDMSGDVFGNGILLHSNLHLLGAFNHLYVYFDPIPVIEMKKDLIDAHCEERRRLFAKGLNWNAYSLEIISPSGGVFSRQDRHIPLDTMAQNTLQTKKTSASAEELIQLLLMAPVDLLWNGGIGTYIKSSTESHFQAQDPVNDRVRIEATALRTKVIAEGGNLGLTPIARVEAARHDVALNADFIDNSAGVNMSDHEVNLKILLNSLIRQEKITLEERNQVINDLSAEQVRLVLQYNEKINLAISLEERRTQTQLIAFRSLIKFLNREGYFVRGKDAIPFESELDELQERNKKLERPIICTLLCYAKLYIHEILNQAPLLETSLYDRYLCAYFPQKLVHDHSESIRLHPLKREIIITELVNELVHSAGMTYFQTMKLRINKSFEDIAHAYLRLSHFLDLPQLREKPDWKNQNEYTETYYQFLLLLADQIFYLNQIILEDERFLNLCIQENRKLFQTIWGECIAKVSSQITPDQYNLRNIANIEEFQEREIIKDFALIEALEDAFHILSLTQLFGKSILVEQYYAVSDRFHLRTLRKIIANLPASNDWEVVFSSRIEKLRRKFIYRYFKGNFQEKKLDDQLFQMIRPIITKQESTSISAPMLYETLVYLNSQLQ